MAALQNVVKKQGEVPVLRTPIILSMQFENGGPALDYDVEGFPKL